MTEPEGSYYKGNNTDYSIKPFNISTDMRGVIDFGDLYQFAPFESGYSFIAVINGPRMANIIDTATMKDKNGKQIDVDKNFKPLQESFINIIENEFRGLDGIEDITSDTMEITDNISTMSLIGKVNQSTSSQITMRFFEKTGALITKYIATYLRYIRDPKTQAKTYGGRIKDGTAYGPAQEVFNMLYIVTDSTCLHVEKAFLLLNAQPTSAGYSELYNTEKGQIETKEITVNWNCFVVDGVEINKVAATYLEKIIVTNENSSGKININSWNMNWTISGIGEYDTKKKYGYDPDGDGPLTADSTIKLSKKKITQLTYNKESGKLE